MKVHKLERKLKHLQMDLGNIKENFRTLPSTYNMYRIMCIKRQINGLKVKAGKMFGKHFTKC